MKRSPHWHLLAVFSLCSWVLVADTRAADLSCWEPQDMVVLQDESDRCNARPLENRIVSQLDFAARSMKKALLIWGENPQVLKQLSEACRYLKSEKHVSRIKSVRLIRVQDSETLDDDFLKSLEMLGRDGYVIYGSKTVARGSARSLEVLGRDALRHNNALGQTLFELETELSSPDAGVLP